MHSWKQYHGNGPNQGMISVRTSSHKEPKWIADIGKVGHASPVIGSDAVIYIGTLDGELVAVNPDGNIKWRKAVTIPDISNHPSMITSSAAIGNDGNIYIISTINTLIENRRNDLLKSIHMRRSILHSFTPSGNRRWSYRFPTNPIDQGLGAYTNASPKLWGDQNIFIFVPVTYSSHVNNIEILIVNQSGNLVNKTEIANYPSNLSANDPSLAEQKNMVWGYFETLKNVDSLTENNTLKDSIYWFDSTLAIMDCETNNYHPIIIIDDNYKTLAAYRWNFPVFSPLWSNHSDKIRHHASPIILSNNKLMVGGKEGLLESYHLENGKQENNPCYKTNGPIISSPASFNNQTYIVAKNQLLLLDANFMVTQQYAFNGECFSSIALSINHLYLSTTEGLYTFSLDLKNVALNKKVIGGLSSPAISQDGTVYIIDNRGKLWAFG